MAEAQGDAIDSELRASGAPLLLLLLLLLPPPLLLLPLLLLLLHRCSCCCCCRCCCLGWRRLPVPLHSSWRLWVAGRGPISVLPTPSTPPASAGFEEEHQSVLNHVITPTFAGFDPKP